MRFLGLGEFGLFAAEPAFGSSDLHAFTGSCADEVGFKFSDHGQDIEQEPTDGIGGVVDIPADAELDFPFGEVLDDVPRVRQGSGEPVELGDDESVPRPACSKGFPESWSFPVGAGQTVVNVDPVFGHVECGEPVALGGEVLLIGRHARVPDHMSSHGADCSGCVT